MGLSCADSYVATSGDLRLATDTPHLPPRWRLLSVTRLKAERSDETPTYNGCIGLAQRPCPKAHEARWVAFRGRDDGVEFILGVEAPVLSGCRLLFRTGPLLRSVAFLTLRIRLIEYPSRHR